MAPWRGQAVYIVVHSGSVSGDSAGGRPTLASSQGREMLTRTPGPPGVLLTLAAADSAGTSQRGKAPATVSGTLSALQLTIEAALPVVPCDQARARLRADLTDLAFPLSGTIALGESWSDSVSNDVCISAIAGVARTRRKFQVVGDTSIAGAPAVIVQRRDSTTLTGEGALDRHAITLMADGTGSARIYLSAPDGRILRIQKEQTLSIAVVSAAERKNFIQKSTSVAELVR